MLIGRGRWRLLGDLIRGFGRDSPLARALLGDDHVWTAETHLLAGIHDRLAQANWQRGGGKGPKPKPIPRPGTRKERRYGKVPAGKTPTDVKAMLARMAGRVPAEG